MATNVAHWDDMIVGPTGFLAEKTARSVAAPGKAPRPGDLVLVDSTDPFSIPLPDPRLSPGKMFAVSHGSDEAPITWNAFPGTTVAGGASLVVNVGAFGSYIFVSVGAEWRILAQYPGV